MKKRTVKDFVALYAPEDEEKLVLIQDGVSADKTFLDTYWAIWGTASENGGSKVIKTAPKELKEKYQQVFA